MPVDLFSVEAPLLIRLPDGEKRVMAEAFPHPEGLLYFDLFWHTSDLAQAVHLVRGSIEGGGPWKVGGCVITVLGCHETDGEVAGEFAAWQDYLATTHGGYLPREEILAVARRYGAEVPEA